MERFRLKVRLWLALAVMCMGILGIGLWGAYNRKNLPPQGPALHDNWTWPTQSRIRWQIDPRRLGF